MAREQITHNHIVDRAVSQQAYGRADVPDAIVHTEIPRRNVHVHWDRAGDGWLQIGIDVTLEDLRSMLAHAEEEALAAARANEHIGEYAVDQHPYRIVSDVLTRVEVNKAIVALRRGRDVAYGKDA